MGTIGGNGDGAFAAGCHDYSFSGIHCSFQPLVLADLSHGTSSLVLPFWLVDAIAK